MAQKKQPFDRVLNLAASAGSNDLRTERVDPGWLLCVQRVAVENETSAYTDLRILKAGHGQEVLLVEQDSPAAATLYWTDEPFYLTTGQYLVCRLTGCSADDVLAAYVSGWKQKLE